MTAVDRSNPATWPEDLTLDDMAVIRQQSASAIRHACKPSSKRPYLPQPYQKRPLRWRKSDVARFLRVGKAA